MVLIGRKHNYRVQTEITELMKLVMLVLVKKAEERQETNWNIELHTLTVIYKKNPHTTHTPHVKHCFKF